jgi:hypothetical protein
MTEESGQNLSAGTRSRAEVWPLGGRLNMAKRSDGRTGGRVGSPSSGNQFISGLSTDTKSPFCLYCTVHRASETAKAIGNFQSK